jgi:hypothetical protein
MALAAVVLIVLSPEKSDMKRREADEIAFRLLSMKTGHHVAM